MIAAEIPEQERAFREDALTYLVSRYERASAVLRERQFDAFRQFVGLWLDNFDWRSSEGVARYLQLTEEQRLERIERFRRQADSWDVTLEFPVHAQEKHQQERVRWRRDFERSREKLRRQQAERASRWESVKEMIEAEHRMRLMPEWLQESFRFLGLPARATLGDARKRYRELAKRYHPDANGSTKDMARLNEVWTKLEAFFKS